MKVGVPALNYLIAILYLAASGITLYLLKLSLSHRKQPKDQEVDT